MLHSLGAMGTRAHVYQGQGMLHKCVSNSEPKDDVE